MYFEPNKSDVKELTRILSRYPEYQGKARGIFSGLEHYHRYYSEYVSVKRGPQAGYLEELKEHFPILMDYIGSKPEEPLSRGVVIVHMLELPLSEIPLYINSRDPLVVDLASWRIKKGATNVR
jgi:hypothetical protein